MALHFTSKLLNATPNGIPSIGGGGTAAPVLVLIALNKVYILIVATEILVSFISNMLSNFYYAFYLRGINI